MVTFLDLETIGEKQTRNIQQSKIGAMGKKLVSI